MSCIYYYSSLYRVNIQAGDDLRWSILTLSNNYLNVPPDMMNKETDIGMMMWYLVEYSPELMDGILAMRDNKALVRYFNNLFLHLPL